MSSSDEDIKVSRFVGESNYGCNGKCKREHRVHLYIAGRVLCCGTYAASCNVGQYHNKFKDMHLMPLPYFMNGCREWKYSAR
jgi:hypothetical protein